MPRRRTVETFDFTHPVTEHVWHVSLMDDGGVELKADHGGDGEYVVRHIFQAGEQSQLSIRRLQAPDS